MKKILIYIAVCFAVTQTTAQITVTAVPPGPRFTLDDLWQITLVQQTIAPQETWLSVSLSVYDENAGRILSTTTKKFQFGKSNVININKTNLTNYGPLKTTYYQRNFKNELAKQGGIFPSGNYKVEVVCNYEGSGFTEPLGKYVYNINAALVMPIQLVSVFNNDTIEDEYPMFNWTPPYPLPEGNITYEILVTEIKPLETPLTAIQRNQPMVRNERVNQNAMVYTTMEPKLIEGKEYAWQVNAYTERGDFYSGSEIWRFVYDPELESLIYEPDQYYLMETKLKNSFVYVDSNILPIKFVEEYKVLDSIAHIYLYNNNLELIADESEIILYKKQGTNYSYVNFCPESFEIATGLFILEIALINDNRYFIRFNNISSPGACPF